MITLVDVLKKTSDYFESRGIPSPRLDAELIIGHSLGLDRMALYMNFDRPLTEGELQAIRPLVRRRGEREPVAWITGSKGFHKLDLVVGPGVLVPRPDTETLVEVALELIEPDEDCYVADACCGSGAIGLALASERPELKLYATDLAREALDCTRDNAQRLGLETRVAILHGSLLDPIPADRPIDYVVSNPPYIASAVLDTLEPEVARFEPRLALDGGPDGLDIYRQLVPTAAARARKAVLMEIGYDQAEAVSALFVEAGLHNVQVHRDLGKNDRVVVGTVSS
jgi:release factor glutamine methyltransferase